ncbi:MAG: 16S rRNA (cytidine(1402)-2'-O)-methyltransferase [Desulfurellaceae bacterium]|nr:16S rRNA (cytidine(1402)-2'-O)-methyltransferase [Desulfurellaceae bacterium]
MPATGAGDVAGTLYIVATPIGNLEDITLRALRILKEVDLIAAEDTRHTRKLLTHYDIPTPLTSYHDHSESTKAPILVETLLAGKSIALVSDAGTPCISDPGYRLVKSAAEVDIPTVPIPGPSMLTALMSVGGLPTDRFAFEGFLPAKKGQRQRALRELCHEERTLIFYESPHRLLSTLSDLTRIFGDRGIVVGRELTKQFEEILRGPVSAVLSAFHNRSVKGEVALAVEGWDGKDESTSEQSAAELMQQLLADGVGLKEAARTVSEACHISKRDAYSMGVKIKAGSRTDNHD